MRKKTAAPGSELRHRHEVAVVVGDGFSPFEFAVPCEVFGVDRSDLGVPWYRCTVASPRGNPVVSAQGFAVVPHAGLDAVATADTIVMSPSEWDLDPPPELLEVLRDADHRGARIMSVCRAAFVLAAAGLLDGRRATTHWMYADELARAHPAVHVDAGVLYVDEGNVLTSAGTAAGIDLCLHVVRRDLGARIANLVARRMVIQPHRDGGQAQYIETPVTPAHDGSDADSFDRILDWMREHLADDLTVPEVSRRHAMSPRTFARRFASVTGTTPHQWLLRQRIGFAQRLLESTDSSVEAVAGQCGFGSAAAFRQQFKRLVGASPSAYRSTFRAEA